MLLSENIRLALSGLKANKMRALLTMLGIIIGIASVIGIMIVGNSLSAEVNESYASMGASNVNVMVIRRWEEDDFSKGGGEVKEREVTDNDYITTEMIEAYCEKYQDKVDYISNYVHLSSTRVEDGKKYANIGIQGVNAGNLKNAKLEMKGGRCFNNTELTSAHSVCIVSNYFVNNLYDGNIDKALGQTIETEINGKSYKFTIIGVYNFVQSSFSFNTVSEKDMETSFYIPLKTAKRINKTSNYSELTVSTKMGVDVDAFVKQTQDFFNKYYEKNKYFQVEAYSMMAMLGEMKSMMKGVTIGISVIGGISLLVGGIGVMNIMLVSITERTREIGTRKALGAPNSSIRIQFIVESIVICVIGGIIGMVLGIGVGMIGCKLMQNTKPVIEESSIVLSFGFSLAIGVFFGYYPANKAAKLDPIEALRYE